MYQFHGWSYTAIDTRRQPQIPHRFGLHLELRPHAVIAANEQACPESAVLHIFGQTVDLNLRLELLPHGEILEIDTLAPKRRKQCARFGDVAERKSWNRR